MDRPGIEPGSDTCRVRPCVSSKPVRPCTIRHMDEFREIVNSLKDGESVDLGGGYRLTKGRGYSEFIESLREDRDPSSDGDPGVPERSLEIPRGVLLRGRDGLAGKLARRGRGDRQAHPGGGEKEGEALTWPDFTCPSCGGDAAPYGEGRARCPCTHVFDPVTREDLVEPERDAESDAD